jgi:hypothetical protein
MTLADYTKVKPVALGNFITRGYTYDGEVVRNARGFYEGVWVGMAKLTPNLQTTLDVKVPSNRKIRDDLKYNWKPLILPQGARVSYAALRLPKAYQEGVGRVPGHLGRGITIAGTTGENLKVSFDATNYRFAGTTPLIASANSAFAPNSYAIAARGNAGDDEAAPSLFTTLTADTAVKLFVSNAGNTAAGTGIRLTGAGIQPTEFAFVLVEVGWFAPSVPGYLENLSLPYDGAELYF